MNPDQVRVIFERVAYHMVLAGWLKGYGFTAGIGHQLVWKKEGAQKALLLKDLSEKFKLTEEDQAALRFHMVCKGAKPADTPPGPQVDIEVTAFWLLCIEELGLEGDEEGMLGLVHLVTSWGPDAETSSQAEAEVK